MDRYTDRDFYMTAEKAKDYGIIDAVAEANSAKMKLLQGQ